MNHPRHSGGYSRSNQHTPGHALVQNACYQCPRVLTSRGCLEDVSRILTGDTKSNNLLSPTSSERAVRVRVAVSTLPRSSEQVHGAHPKKLECRDHGYTRRTSSSHKRIVFDGSCDQLFLSEVPDKRRNCDQLLSAVASDFTCSLLSWLQHKNHLLFSSKVTGMSRALPRCCTAT